MNKNEESLLIALGRMTQNFGVLEHVIRLIIWSLMKAEDRVAQCVTSQSSFRNLCVLAGSLYKMRIREDEKRERFDNLLGQALKIEESRNRFTHSLYGTNDDGSILRMKPKARAEKEFKWDFVIQSVSEIDTTCTNIRNLTDLIGQFGKEENLIPSVTIFENL